MLWSRCQQREGASSRAAVSRCDHALHIRPPATRRHRTHAGRQAKWSRRKQGRGRGFEGCLRHQALMPFMFASLQHGGTVRTTGVSQWSRGASRGEGAGSRGVASRCVHALHIRPPATRRHRTHAGRQPMEPAPRAGQRARVRGLWRHVASMCTMPSMPSMFAILQHAEAPHARRVSANGAGATAGSGRGFEGCGVTVPSCPACSQTCNTRRNRTHEWGQP